jgi:hypothetical protein
MAQAGFSRFSFQKNIPISQSTTPAIQADSFGSLLLMRYVESAFDRLTRINGATRLHRCVNKRCQNRLRSFKELETKTNVLTNGRMMLPVQ